MDLEILNLLIALEKARHEAAMALLTVDSPSDRPDKSDGVTVDLKKPTRRIVGQADLFIHQAVYNGTTAVSPYGQHGDATAAIAASLEDCVIESPDGVLKVSSNLRFEKCLFINTVIECSENSSITVTDCAFVSNGPNGSALSLGAVTGSCVRTLFVGFRGMRQSDCVVRFSPSPNINAPVFLLEDNLSYGWGRSIVNYPERGLESVGNYWEPGTDDIVEPLGFGLEFNDYVHDCIYSSKSWDEIGAWAKIQELREGYRPA